MRHSHEFDSGVSVTHDHENADPSRYPHYHASSSPVYEQPLTCQGAGVSLGDKEACERIIAECNASLGTDPEPERLVLQESFGVIGRAYQQVNVTFDELVTEENPYLMTVLEVIVVRRATPGLIVQ